MKVLNKGYRNLRNNIFPDIEISQFMELYKHYVKLSRQYGLLCFCNFLENINIPVIELPILRLITMLLDFIRWKMYDFLIGIINGRKFDLYGVSCYCGRQR